VQKHITEMHLAILDYFLSNNINDIIQHIINKHHPQTSKKNPRAAKASLSPEETASCTVVNFSFLWTK